MRALFDAGLVDVLAVSRAALAPPGTPNDASLLYGSAPNVYALTARGLEALHRAGLADVPDEGRKRPAYGPRNSLFLAHELAVRDVRVWLELAVRENGYELERWQDGEAAAIGLERERALLSRSARMPGSCCVWDGRYWSDWWRWTGGPSAGTGAGARNWTPTRRCSQRAFALGNGLRQRAGAGHRPGRSAPDRLADMIGEADEGLASRFWIAETGRP